MRRAHLVVCTAVALAAAGGPAVAATQYGVRIGPATYNHSLGSMGVYGLNVALPVPILDVSGSLEYSSKRTATFDPDVSCQALGCPTAVDYDFRDLASRVTVALPIYQLPGLAKAYIGGGLGYHWIRVPQYDDPTGEAPPHEFATDSEFRSSYHAVAGARIGLFATHLGGFAEARVSWIQTDQVIRQTALFVGLSLQP